MRQRRTWLAGLALTLGLALACALTLALAPRRPGQLPDAMVALGPLAVSAGEVGDSSCAEPLIICERADERRYYAIWVVVRTGPAIGDYRHGSIHIPLR